MKKFVLAVALCAASSISMAATVCAAGVASQVTGADTNFVKTSFTPRCSANTQADFQQTANTAAVGSASTKGNQSFGGHSNGGAVEKVADSATGYADAAAALAAAVSAATAKLAASSS